MQDRALRHLLRAWQGCRPLLDVLQPLEPVVLLQPLLSIHCEVKVRDVRCACLQVPYTLMTIC